MDTKLYCIVLFFFRSFFCLLVKMSSSHVAAVKYGSRRLCSAISRTFFQSVVGAPRYEEIEADFVKTDEWCSYSVFQGFSKAKFAYGGSIFSSSQFLILPQLPQKMKLTSKVVKIDPEIIVSLLKI